MHLPFWLTTAALSPVILWQGRKAKRDTPRLPEASGHPSGQHGDGEPQLSLLVLGESTAAGVGVQTHDQGLASQLARQLHNQTGQTVAWHTHGINGATLAQLISHLESASLPAADMVLLSMGVNDTTALTPRAAFRQQLLDLRNILASRYPHPMRLLSVPPMHRFTALPVPLRQVLGWRARLLDGVYRDLAREESGAFVHLRYPLVTDSRLLAEDGYHPGEEGYRVMAGALVDQLQTDELSATEKHSDSLGTQ